MTNLTQFRDPDGNDKDDIEVLRSLVLVLAEALPQGGSMSQNLTPDDCLEYERDYCTLSRTIEDFREKGNTITRIDADIDTPVFSTDGKAYLNFRAVIQFKNSRNGSETTVFRQYGVSFKKGQGRWQAIRDADDLSDFLVSVLAVRPVWIAHPPMTESDDQSHPPGRYQVHSDSEGVSSALQELAGAILGRDVSELERILTDDYDGWFPQVRKNGYDFCDPISKAQQIAAVEKHRSSIEKFEIGNLRVYPTEGGEMGAIALFTAGSLFQVDGMDSKRRCGYCVRLDKQPDHWKVSMIRVSPLFDLTPPPSLSLSDMDYEDEFEGEQIVDFEYDPDWLKKKRTRE
jgi:hypothetical protein